MATTREPRQSCDRTCEEDCEKLLWKQTVVVYAKGCGGIIGCTLDGNYASCSQSKVRKPADSPEAL